MRIPLAYIGALSLCLFLLAPVAATPGKSFVFKSRAYKAQPASAESKRGEELFAENKCATCHSVDGKGGCIGPPLDGVGAYRSREFIYLRISQGNEVRFQKLLGREELMPHLRLAPAGARALASYLLTLKPPANGIRVVSHTVQKPDAGKDDVKPEQENVAEGKKLFFDKGCTSCHSVNNVGGRFAPNLDMVGRRKGRKFIIAQMGNAEFMNDSQDEYSERGHVMPPSNLTQKEIAQIADFLMTLPDIK